MAKLEEKLFRLNGPEVLEKAVKIGDDDKSIFSIMLVSDKMY